ncbi:TetR family transcriptional regulator [Actinoplanes sp. NPDC024001]|uniref:TetR/AcrR family transcriptional regulator n=1 Tax=Actinoplanes sp. NPDC024001 TaxID=3154598 RepID=UPI0033D2A68D
MPENKTGRRDLKKQRTRGALTVAALRLVDERGLDQVTVDEIAEAAGVSPRTFFNYFATKCEALVGDLFVDDSAGRERFLAVERSVPTLDALLIALTPTFDAIQAERDFWLLRLRVLGDNPSLLTDLLGRSAATEQTLAAAIAERLGIAADSAYALHTAAAVEAAIRVALMRWAAGDGTRPLSAFLHEAFTLLTTGLAHPYPCGSLAFDLDFPVADKEEA